VSLRNDTDLGTQRSDEREFGPCLARREQSPDARRIAVDPPRQLGFGDAKVSPERGKLADRGPSQPGWNGRSPSP
jgi:hypothetical protein